MKINVARSAGFCFGVRRAIDIAFQAARGHKNVYMLGDIVHNEEVVREIEKAGIKKIKRLGKGKGKTLLIRAHGAGKQLYKAAKGAGYAIIDATCPMVKEIHKIARQGEQQGYKVVVIGDRKHDEVQGILGQINSRGILVTPGESLRLPAGIKKAWVVVQSTQDRDKVLDTLRRLKCAISTVRYFDTVCGPTRAKQQEIKIMPLKNEVMVIIGSRSSANTRRLYEIARSLNRRSHWIDSPAQLKAAWFSGARSVGVTSGASTPDSITRQVIERIKKLSC